MLGEPLSPALDAGPAARANLNAILRELVQHLLDKGPHANFFRNPVSCVVVDDYRDHVPADNEMYLNKILERTEAQHYANVATFRADLQLMYDNAAAYNGRNGGKHAYEPVINWAADMLTLADKELQQRTQALLGDTAAQQSPCHGSGSEKPDVPNADPAGDPAVFALVPVLAAKTVATGPPSDGPGPPSASPPADPCMSADEKPPSLPSPQEQQPQDDCKPLSPVEQQQQQEQGQQPGLAAAAAQGSPRAANGSAGQQSSSPSSGSGDGAHSGLEALLAACELAAEQDSAAPRSGPGATGANAVAPERHSYPGCGGDGVLAKDAHPQQQPQPAAGPAAGGEAAANAGAGPLSVPRQLPAGGQLSLQQPQQQQQHDDPKGSSEGAGMALCSVRSGGGAEGVVSAVQPGGPLPGGGRGGSAGGGAGGANGSYLASNAFKNRRHKSKVYIKPNKVVYLPTTFVEEEFDVTALPLECELRVEADGVQTDETFRVTIKSVPRQGLSTMYCMTNVMRFQQQYLNWQIYNWTRIDNGHIKIHLQAPSPSQAQLQRPDMDRAASMPEQAGRNLVAVAQCMDGVTGGQPRAIGTGGAAASSSLKRKSDTGRYTFAPRVERRLVVEPGRDLPADLRLSSTGFLQYPSSIPESPPASPQRRVSACIAAAAAGAAAAAALPPRAPSAQAPGLAHHGSRLPPHGPHHQPQQVHVHIHQHQHPGLGAYQGQLQSQQQHHHPHPHPQQLQQQQQQRLLQIYHPHLHNSVGNNAGLPPFPLQQQQHQQQQQQRGSNSSIRTEHQTCSEDSSGPVVGAEAVASVPLVLPLTWHPAAAGLARPGLARASAGARGGPAASLHPLELSRQLQEVADQLQAQAQAAGGELPALAALQLAMSALQQQQIQQQIHHHQQQQQPLDLSSAVDQERLLQQLGLAGVSLHPHAHAPPNASHTQRYSRGPRGSGGCLLDLEMAEVHASATSSARRSGSGGVDGMVVGGQDGDGEAAAAGVPRGGAFAQRRPSKSGAVEPYGQLVLQQPDGAPHGERQQHQQRRSSHGDRCRQQQGALALVPAGAGGEGADGGRNLPPPDAAAASQQRAGDGGERADAADADAAAKSAAAAAASEEDEGEQRGKAADEEMGELHHIVCHPRRSGNGGGAGRLLPGAAAAAGFLSGGGRILLDVGALGGGGGAAAPVGGRVSGSGRRADLGLASQAGGGVGLAAFPPGLDLADCGPADIFTFLSPSKRFKVAVSSENATAAAVTATMGGSELSVLDVLSLRAAAGGLPGPAEAALAAALRQGGGGGGGVFPQAAAAAAALGGRPFLPVGSEVMGQLM
ncbi:hypothetical protein PLESTM_001291200 [Pleodorina starrii]|nr:hypothetical protein PLESTM_001291200 [Pleodorina starrii]